MAEEQTNTQSGEGTPAVVGSADALPAGNRTSSATNTTINTGYSGTPDTSYSGSPQTASTPYGNVTIVPGYGGQFVGGVAGNAANQPAAGTITGEAGQALTDYNTVMSDGTPNVGLESATNIVNDPSSFLGEEGQLSNQDFTVGTEGTLLDGSSENYQMDTDGLNVTSGQGSVTTAGTTQGVATTVDGSIATNPGVTSYEAATTQEDVEGALGTAATGEVSDEAMVSAEQIDMQGTATGYNADGTVNYTGQALTQFASQNISTMIDTSTVAGKLLAQELGEGNYTDTKATVMGQLNVISSQFTGADGQPKIPSWAQATARNVARIAAFKGMTGSAATAAMSTAIMEATLPIAQDEARFFQTVTLTNLDNKQQATINRANVLAKMDQINLDARMTAAIQNSRNFMDMDLANLNNEQQMEIVNTQSRVQALLEDARATNTQRMFTAENTMDMQKYYDQLGANIAMFNTEQVNGMSQFNAAESNATARFNAGEMNAMSMFNVEQANIASQFNAQLENNREQFYREMQYNIDISNAEWRREVSLTETKMQFEAAALDVQNMFDISTEAQNQLWDRADSILDYIWKSNETAADRATRLEEARMGASATKSAGRSAGIGSAVGAVAGALIGL
tara:strand:+ start:19102 stop:20979 length:1878 start_codon:yes stop_codon:yes gene_type:complete